MADVPTYAEIDAAIRAGKPGQGQPGPNPRLANLLLKKMANAIVTSVQTVSWGNIAGAMTDSSALVAALAGKSDVGHRHTADQIAGIGEAAQLGVAASGIASAVEVVTGADPRLVDTRDPNPHSHDQIDIEDLVADLAIAKADWLNVPLPSVDTGTITLEEYAPVAMTVTALAYRAPLGSVTLALKIDGVTVTGSVVTTAADQSRVLATATANNVGSIGSRTDLVIVSATDDAQLSLTVMRARA